MEVNKNLDKPDNTATLFKNFSDEDFSYKWDGEIYSFRAGDPVYMEAWKAKHFAKHLVDREVQKLTKMKDGKEVPRTVNDPVRRELEAKCFPEGLKPKPEESKVGEKVSTDLESNVMNKNKDLEKKVETQVETAQIKPSLKDIPTLREIYETVVGKKPFNGWNAEKLQKKIDEAKSTVGAAEAGFAGA